MFCQQSLGDENISGRLGKQGTLSFDMLDSLVRVRPIIGYTDITDTDTDTDNRYDLII